MIYRGRVKNGVVVLEDPVKLPEGAEVQVNLPEAPANDAAEESVATLHERLKPFIGAVEGLPNDFSVNHDHYLYGTPKK